jgi:hypothetical protein
VLNQRIVQPPDHGSGNGRHIPGEHHAQILTDKSSM